MWASSKVRTRIRENKSYGIFIMTEVRGMEDVIDQAAGIFEIVVKARLETKLDELLIISTIIKHPYIAKIDKKLKSYSKRGNQNVEEPRAPSMVNMIIWHVRSCF